jgi:hypothetical protein
VSGNAAGQHAIEACDPRGADRHGGKRRRAGLRARFDRILAKTSATLEIAFWENLGDRLAVPRTQAIPPPREIIFARAKSP